MSTRDGATPGPMKAGGDVLAVTATEEPALALQPQPPPSTPPRLKGAAVAVSLTNWLRWTKAADVGTRHQVEAELLEEQRVFQIAQAKAEEEERQQQEILRAEAAAARAAAAIAAREQAEADKQRRRDAKDQKRQQEQARRHADAERLAAKRAELLKIKTRREMESMRALAALGVASPSRPGTPVRAPLRPKVGGGDGSTPLTSGIPRARGAGRNWFATPAISVAIAGVVKEKGEEQEGKGGAADSASGARPSPPKGGQKSTRRRLDRGQNGKRKRPPKVPEPEPEPDFTVTHIDTGYGKAGHETKPEPQRHQLIGGVVELSPAQQQRRDTALRTKEWEERQPQQSAMSAADTAADDIDHIVSGGVAMSENEIRYMRKVAMQRQRSELQTELAALLGGKLTEVHQAGEMAALAEDDAKRQKEAALRALEQVEREREEALVAEQQAQKEQAEAKAAKEVAAGLTAVSQEAQEAFEREELELKKVTADLSREQEKLREASAQVEEQQQAAEDAQTELGEREKQAATALATLRRAEQNLDREQRRGDQESVTRHLQLVENAANQLTVREAEAVEGRANVAREQQLLEEARAVAAENWHTAAEAQACLLAQQRKSKEARKLAETTKVAEKKANRIADREVKEAKDAAATAARERSEADQAAVVAQDELRVAEQVDDVAQRERAWAAQAAEDLEDEAAALVANLGEPVGVLLGSTELGAEQAAFLNRLDSHKAAALAALTAGSNGDDSDDNSVLDQSGDEDSEKDSGQITSQSPVELNRQPSASNFALASLAHQDSSQVSLAQRTINLKKRVDGHVQLATGAFEVPKVKKRKASVAFVEAIELGRTKDRGEVWKQITAFYHSMYLNLEYRKMQYEKLETLRRKVKALQETKYSWHQSLKQLVQKAIAAHDDVMQAEKVLPRDRSDSPTLGTSTDDANSGLLHHSLSAALGIQQSTDRSSPTPGNGSNLMNLTSTSVKSAKSAMSSVKSTATSVKSAISSVKSTDYLNEAERMLQIDLDGDGDIGIDDDIDLDGSLREQQLDVDRKRHTEKEALITLLLAAKHTKPGAEVDHKSIEYEEGLLIVPLISVGLMMVLVLTMSFAPSGLLTNSIVWTVATVVTYALTVPSIDPKDRHRGCQLALWMYMLVMFLLPVTLMVNGDPSGKMPTVGGYLFLMSLWSSGWVFMWYKDELARVPSGDTFIMPFLPHGFSQKLKLYTTAYEGYVYCGFSFFPGVPWKNVETPEALPPLDVVMTTGMFEFGEATHYLMFMLTCLFVPLSFYALRRFKDSVGKFVLVTNICFDALSFPVIKIFTSVFACTGANSFHIDRKQQVVIPFCDITALNGAASCMDSAPTVACWSKTHFVHIVIVFLLVVPYYVAGLVIRTQAQAKSSAVVIDGSFSIIVFQVKIGLAIFACGFGDCHALIIVSSVFAAVAVMLLFTTSIGQQAKWAISCRSCVHKIQEHEERDRQEKTAIEELERAQEALREAKQHLRKNPDADSVKEQIRQKNERIKRAEEDLTTAQNERTAALDALNDAQETLKKAKADGHHDSERVTAVRLAKEKARNAKITLKKSKVIVREAKSSSTVLEAENLVKKRQLDVVRYRRGFWEKRGMIPRRFSNVVSLEIVRVTGLVAGMANGMFGLYITLKFPTQACGTKEEMRIQHNKNVGASASYFEFFLLIFINIAIVVGSLAYWKLSYKNILQSTTAAAELEQDVDYAIVMKRIENWKTKERISAVKKKIWAKFTKSKGASLGRPAVIPGFPLWLQEVDADKRVAQQIEDVTLDLALYSKRRPPKLAVQAMDMRTEGGHRFNNMMTALADEVDHKSFMANLTYQCKENARALLPCLPDAEQRATQALSISFTEESGSLGQKGTEWKVFEKVWRIKGIDTVSVPGTGYSLTSLVRDAPDVAEEVWTKDIKAAEKEVSMLFEQRNRALYLFGDGTQSIGTGGKSKFVQAKSTRRLLPLDGAAQDIESTGIQTMNIDISEDDPNSWVSITEFDAVYPRFIAFLEAYVRYGYQPTENTEVRHLTLGLSKRQLTPKHGALLTAWLLGMKHNNAKGGLPRLKSTTSAAMSTRAGIDLLGSFSEDEERKPEQKGDSKWEVFEQQELVDFSGLDLAGNPDFIGEEKGSRGCEWMNFNEWILRKNHSLLTISLRNTGLHATALQKLRLPHQLQSLDVSHNPLVGLDEFGGGFENQRGLKHLCGAIISHPCLERLDAVSCQLNVTSVPMIAQMLTEAKQLRVLNIAGNYISEQGTHMIAESLETSNIETLLIDLGGTRTAVELSVGLCTLDAAEIELFSAGVELLSQWVCCRRGGCRRVESIAGGIEIVDTATREDTKRVILASNPLTEAPHSNSGKDTLSGWADLCVTLTKYDSFQYLDVSFCGLAADAAKLIATKVISQGDIAHLRYLNIAGNNIGDVGKRSLCESFRGSALQRLLLDLGAGNTTVELSVTLPELDATDIQLTSVGMELLSSWVRYRNGGCRCFTDQQHMELAAWRNQDGDIPDEECVDVVSAVLSGNNLLQKAADRGSRRRQKTGGGQAIDLVGWNHLCQTLMDRPLFCRLDVSDCGLDATAAYAIASCIKNGHLKALNIAKNNLGAQGKRALASSLQDSGMEMMVIDLGARDTAVEFTIALPLLFAAGMYIEDADVDFLSAWVGFCGGGCRRATLVKKQVVQKPAGRAPLARSKTHAVLLHSLQTDGKLQRVPTQSVELRHNKLLELSGSDYRPHDRPAQQPVSTATPQPEAAQPLDVGPVHAAHAALQSTLTKLKKEWKYNRQQLSALPHWDPRVQLTAHIACSLCGVLGDPGDKISADDIRKTVSQQGLLFINKLESGLNSADVTDASKSAIEGTSLAWTNRHSHEESVSQLRQQLNPKNTKLEHVNKLFEKLKAGGVTKASGKQKDWAGIQTADEMRVVFREVEDLLSWCFAARVYLNEEVKYLQSTLDLLEGVALPEPQPEPELEPEPVHDSSWIHLCRILSQQEHFARLDVSACGLNANAASFIATEVISHSNIKFLNISGNKIGEQGKRYLAASFGQSSLEGIWLDLGTSSIEVHLDADMDEFDATGREFEEVDMYLIASWFAMADAKVRKLLCESTGADTRVPYELNSTKSHFELKSKCLAGADWALICMWFSKKEVMNLVEAVDLSGNRLELVEKVYDDEPEDVVEEDDQEINEFPEEELRAARKAMTRLQGEQLRTWKGHVNNTLLAITSFDMKVTLVFELAMCLSDSPATTNFEEIKVAIKSKNPWFPVRLDIDDEAVSPAAIEMARNKRDELANLGVIEAVDIKSSLSAVVDLLRWCLARLQFLEKLQEIESLQNARERKKLDLEQELLLNDPDDLLEASQTGLEHLCGAIRILPKCHTLVLQRCDIGVAELAKLMELIFEEDSPRSCISTFSLAHNDLAVRYRQPQKFYCRLPDAVFRSEFRAEGGGIPEQLRSTHEALEPHSQRNIREATLQQFPHLDKCGQVLSLPSSITALDLDSCNLDLAALNALTVSCDWKNSSLKSLSIRNNPQVSALWWIEPSELDRHHDLFIDSLWDQWVKSNRVLRAASPKDTGDGDSGGEDGDGGKATRETWMSYEELRKLYEMWWHVSTTSDDQKASTILVAGKVLNVIEGYLEMASHPTADNNPRWALELEKAGLSSKGERENAWWPGDGDWVDDTSGATYRINTEPPDKEGRLRLNIMKFGEWCGFASFDKENNLIGQAGDLDKKRARLIPGKDNAGITKLVFQDQAKSTWTREAQRKTKFQQLMQKGLDKDAFRELHSFTNLEKVYGTLQRNVERIPWLLVDSLAGADIEILDLSGCALNDRFVATLDFSALPKLRTLIIGSNWIGHDGKQSLTKSIPSSVQSLTIDLGEKREKRDDDDASPHYVYYANPVVLSSDATSLDLSSQRLTQSDACFLAWWLSRDGPKTKLTELDVSHNDLTSGGDGLATLFDCLPKTNVQILHLRSCNLTSLHSLTQSLGRTELSTLDISENYSLLEQQDPPMGGWLDFVEALAGSHLSVFKATQVGMDTVGTRALAECMQTEDVSLKTVMIESTGTLEYRSPYTLFCDKCQVWGARTDKAALPKTIEMTAARPNTIDLSKIHIGAPDVALVACWLGMKEVATNLVELTLDSTGKMSKQKTYTLRSSATSVDLSHHNLGSSDAILLAAWLKIPRVAETLASLDITFNVLRAEGIHRIAAAAQSTVLQTLGGLTEGQETAVLTLSGTEYPFTNNVTHDLIMDSGVLDNPLVMAADIGLDRFSHNLHSIIIDATGDINAVVENGTRPYEINCNEIKQDFSSIMMGYRDLELLAAWLTRHPKQFNTLNISLCEIVDDPDASSPDLSSWDMFCAALEASSLRTLVAQKLRAGETHGKAFHTLGAQWCPYLTSVDLRDNTIGQGAEPLIAVIERSKKVGSLLGLNVKQSHLDLTSNIIDEGTAKVLAAEIGREGTQITSCDLRGAAIGKEGVDALIKIYKSNTVLKTLLGWSINDSTADISSATLEEECTNCKAQNDEDRAIRMLAMTRLLTAELPAQKRLRRSWDSDMNYPLKALRAQSTGELHCAGKGTQPYQLNVFAEHIDLSKKGLGPTDVSLLESWLHTKDVISRKLLTIDLSNNPGLVGIIDKSGKLIKPDHYTETMATFITAISKVIDLYSGKIFLRELSLANISMGPLTLRVLAKTLKSFVGRCHTLLKVDISCNPVIVGDTAIDVKPADPLAVEQPGFWDLCEAMSKLGCIEELLLNDTGMGPIAASIVSRHLLGTSRSTVKKLHVHGNVLGRWGKLAMFPSPDPDLNKLEELKINLGQLSKTFPKGQARQLLSHGVEEDWRAGLALDDRTRHSKATLGEEDAELLAKWMVATKHSRMVQAGLSAATMRLNLLGNGFGLTGGQCLSKAFFECPSFETLIGLQNHATSLDLAGMGVHCGTIKLLSMELDQVRTRVPLESINLANNPFILLDGKRSLGETLPKIAIPRHGDKMAIRLKTLKFDLHGRRQVIDIRNLPPGGPHNIWLHSPIEGAQLSFSSKSARVRWQRQLRLFIVDPTSVSARLESGVEVNVRGPAPYDTSGFEPGCSISLDMRLDPESGEKIRSLVILNRFGNEYASVPLYLSHTVVKNKPSRFNSVTLQSDATEIDLSASNAEPAGEADMHLLAGWLRTPCKASSGEHKIYDELDRLALNSTGKPGHPKKYSLECESAATRIHLNGFYIGPADVLVLAAWLAKANVREYLTELDLGDNWIFGRKHKAEKMTESMHVQLSKLLASDAHEAAVALESPSNQPVEVSQGEVELVLRWQLCAFMFGLKNTDLTSRGGTRVARSFKLGEEKGMMNRELQRLLYDRIESTLFNLNTKGDTFMASPQLRSVRARHLEQMAEVPDPRILNDKTPLSWIIFNGRRPPLYSRKYLEDRVGGKALALDDESADSNAQEEAEANKAAWELVGADQTGGEGWRVLADAINSCPKLTALNLGALGLAAESDVAEVLAPLRTKWGSSFVESHELREGCCTYNVE